MREVDERIVRRKVDIFAILKLESKELTTRCGVRSPRGSAVLSGGEAGGGRQGAGGARAAGRREGRQGPCLLFPSHALLCPESERVALENEKSDDGKRRTPRTLTSQRGNPKAGIVVIRHAARGTEIQVTN